MNDNNDMNAITIEHRLMALYSLFNSEMSESSWPYLINREKSNV